MSKNKTVIIVSCIVVITSAYAGMRIIGYRASQEEIAALTITTSVSSPVIDESQYKRIKLRCYSFGRSFDYKWRKQDITYLVTWQTIPEWQTAYGILWIDGENQAGWISAKYGGHIFRKYLRVVTEPITDTDNDGIDDAWETVGRGISSSNPYDAVTDVDKDGLNAYLEYIANSNPKNADTDGDGLDDGKEYFVTQTLLNSNDTDGDGIPDNEDDDPNGVFENIPEFNPDGVEIEILYPKATPWPPEPES